MDTPAETGRSSESADLPRKGEVFRVLDNAELRGEGGLALHTFLENGDQVTVGPRVLEDKVVRLPIGTQVTAERVFKNEDGVWIVFNYQYNNPNKGLVQLHVCAMVKKTGWNSVDYMEKVNPTQAALQQLKDELQA